MCKVFGNSTISWNSKKQNSVAASSTEAEYMALFESVKEALWLKSLLGSISINVSNAIPFFEDNKGCICIAKNPTNHKRTKHIDIKYHFSRDHVLKGNVIIEYILTAKQLADAFTKPLPTIKFSKIRTNIGMH